MTEVRHLQLVILSIIKDLDKIATKYNIPYYLLGGSCIGAIRHKGFIPWDDDLDIILTRENYNKLIEACKKDLDLDKYYLQEGLKDWPLAFTKIRLMNTYLQEPEDDYASEEKHGIYIDIFPMDNVPDSKIKAALQYVLAKYYLCYLLGLRKYKSASFTKKLMMLAAYPLRINILRKAIVKYIEKFNKVHTKALGFFYGRTRYRNSITSRSIYGKPTYVPFEDTLLPVPEHYHEYLTQLFGDYMKLPPEDQQKGLHLISVDFGKY